MSVDFLFLFPSQNPLSPTSLETHFTNSLGRIVILSNTPPGSWNYFRFDFFFSEWRCSLCCIRSGRCPASVPHSVPRSAEALSRFVTRPLCAVHVSRHHRQDGDGTVWHTRVSWPSCNGMPNTFTATRPVTEKIRINNFRSNESFDVACGRRNVNLPATFFNA